MSTLAIVGAGPQLGQAIARRFTREGWNIALIARTQRTLDAMVDELGVPGAAEGFAADLTDRAGLTDALVAAEARFGPIDALEFSPGPSPADLSARPFAEASRLTVDSVLPEFELWVLGAVTAITHVLPGMLERGDGTVLVTTGAGSGPMIIPAVANVQIATAGLRNWILNLHASVAERGVYAAHVAIADAIGAGRPEMEPDAIAEAYWQLHTERLAPELIYPELPDTVPELAERYRPGLSGPDPD